MEKKFAYELVDVSDDVFEIAKCNWLPVSGLLLP
jgi:hypothetical protein